MFIYFKTSTHVGLLGLLITNWSLLGCHAEEPLATAEDRKNPMQQTSIQESLKKLNVNTDDIEIAPSVVQGISEITIGLQVLYATNDGAYLFGGPLIKTESGINMSNLKIAQVRKSRLDSAETTPLFKYAASDPKHKITVITDIDCPHCRRLHNEIPALQTAGVEVNYVMLPRAGKASPSYSKTVSAACATQPESAITQAMLGKQTPPNTCKHPIDQHMQLARALNISSTPAIMFEDGHLELGYKPADALIELLDNHFEK